MTVIVGSVVRRCRAKQCLAQTLTIWFRFCCDSGVALLDAAGAAVPAAGPTPLTTAVVVGVGKVPFGPTLALRGPAGLGGGIFEDICVISTSFGCRDCCAVVVVSSV